jgi:hypothetical protein
MASCTVVFFCANGGPASVEIVRAIHYEFHVVLHVKDGKIATSSDLWMGCLFTPAKVISSDDSRIPFCEWFDWRPLPAILGSNSTDLKKLGVLDHRPELAADNLEEADRSSAVETPPPPAVPTEP